MAKRELKDVKGIPEKERADNPAGERRGTEEDRRENPRDVNQFEDELSRVARDSKEKGYHEGFNAALNMVTSQRVRDEGGSVSSIACVNNDGVMLSVKHLSTSDILALGTERAEKLEKIESEIALLTIKKTPLEFELKNLIVEAENRGCNVKR